MRTHSKARKGKFVFKRIGQFATNGDVVADGNCGYHALMVALDYIDRKCKGTVKEVRRDIWEFAMNRKSYTLNNGTDFRRIHRDDRTHTGRISKKIG